MSLFDDSNYRWRETYFLFHHKEKRPTADQVKETLDKLTSKIELHDLKQDQEGRFESITIMAPDAYSAIDISYVTGEEVAEQLEAIQKEMKSAILEGDERRKLQRLNNCDARFDLLHFEQVVDSADDAQLDECFDPAGLLVVLEELSELCDGVGVDPASASLM